VGEESPRKDCSKTTRQGTTVTSCAGFDSSVECPVRSGHPCPDLLVQAVRPVQAFVKGGCFAATDFCVPRCAKDAQTAAGMLRSHALARGLPGAKKHRLWVRHDTGPLASGVRAGEGASFV
jgi:hypothetical protein